MLHSSNDLIKAIQTIIANHDGLLPFARFMELALYHPEWGYYAKPSFSIGKQGDFITAPEVSPLFAHCLARQTAQVLTHLGGGDILELGAGSGSLAKELLPALASLGAPPKHYYIYEISPGLRTKQQALLAQMCPEWLPRIIWLDKLSAPFSGVMIANEVLDALPVHCFRYEQGNLFERFVSWQQGQFIWQLGAPSTVRLKQEIDNILAEVTWPADGYESEINLELSSFLQPLVQMLQRGVILLADYGYGKREYYHPERCHGTLTCFKRHAKHDNPLIHVGEQDITAHVDFTRVADIACSNDCQLAGFTSQSAFLLATGLPEHAEVLEKSFTEIEKFHLHQAIKTLTLPTEMGERIKFMGLSKNCDISLLGFQTTDRRREL